MTTKEKHTPFALVIVFIVALGGLIFGYNTAIISGALIFLGQHFSLTVFEEGLAVSGILIGAIGGVSCGGMLADFWGRRLTIILTAILFMLTSWMTAESETFYLFLIGRLLGGIAIGITSVTAPLYLAEIAPAHQRGAFVCVYQLAVTIGIFFAYCINYLFASASDWRTMIALGIIPAIIQFIGMLFLPESPSWLLTKGKNSKAEKVFEKIRKDRGWERHLSEMKDCAAPLKEIGWKRLFNPSLKKVMIIGVGISIFQQITGINTVIYYAPKIFQMVGFTSPAMAILPTVGIGLINVIATAISVPLLDRIGRRTLLFIGQVGMAISLIILSLAFFTDSAMLDVIVILCIMAYVASFAIGLGAVTFVIISEIYPLSIRGRAMSVAIVANWVSNYLVSLTFLDLVKAMGIGGTFFLYAMITGAAFWFVYKLVPETKGKTLEEIEQSIS